MKNIQAKRTRFLNGSAFLLAFGTSVCAQEKPYSQPGTGQPIAPPTPAAEVKSAPTPAPTSDHSVAQFFDAHLPDAIAKGKFSLNSRLRFEYVDQDGVPAITDESYAPTIRTRFGYTSAPLHGFQGMIEGENVTTIGPVDNYNAAGSNGVGYKPVVADPPTTEVNQAWISYSYTNLFSIKGGRQRIALDNHRFVGDVGWRQNMQTFDAAGLEAKPVKNLTLGYHYVWDVHRVFGDVDRLPAANRDFDSRSHLINAAYSGFKFGRVVGYSYLLDLENSAGAANSTATYGGYFAGSTPLSDAWSLGYRAEAAWQTDYADSLLEYEAEYYNVELSATVKRLAFGGGYEVLGSDSNDNGPGSVGFKTPLATLHAFNGWADVFLTTPAKGLRDLYGFAQITLPHQIPLRLVYHKFDADSGGGDFGYELDVMASKKFGKYWTALVKYSFYDGEDAAPPSFGVPIDVHKFWAQVEFAF